MKKNSFKTKIQNILPSKNFAIIMGIGITLCVVVFGVMFFVEGKENFASKKKNKGLEGKTVSDLVQLDTDGDSLADWEEALWGTDKNSRVTFEGQSDVAYVENKKKSLRLEGEVTENETSETDKFAREFFSAYAAMKSGGVDPMIINNFSNALGQKIVDPELIDPYTEKDVKIESLDTEESRASYYLKIKEVFDKHAQSGIGDELTIVSGTLVSAEAGTGDSAELTLIAEAYSLFAKEIMEVAVPETLTEYHLAIANSASNTGLSVSNMTKIINDPIIGLSGISQYQKYSETLVTAVSNLEDNL